MQSLKSVGEIDENLVDNARALKCYQEALNIGTDTQRKMSKGVIEKRRKKLEQRTVNANCKLKMLTKRLKKSMKQKKNIGQFTGLRKRR